MTESDWLSIISTVIPRHLKEHIIDIVKRAVEPAELRPARIDLWFYKYKLKKWSFKDPFSRLSLSIVQYLLENGKIKNLKYKLVLKIQFSSERCLGMIKGYLDSTG